MPISNSINSFNASVTNTKQEVDNNPTNYIHTIYCLNTTVAIAYLQVFDLDADNVTVGTTPPTFVFAIPASDGKQINFNTPLRFLNGFTIASTTGRANNIGAIQEVTIGYISQT